MVHCLRLRQSVPKSWYIINWVVNCSVYNYIVCNMCILYYSYQEGSGCWTCGSTSLLVHIRKEYGKIWHIHRQYVPGRFFSPSPSNSLGMRLGIVSCAVPPTHPTREGLGNRARPVCLSGMHGRFNNTRDVINNWIPLVDAGRLQLVNITKLLC